MDRDKSVPGLASTGDEEDVEVSSGRAGGWSSSRSAMTRRPSASIERTARRGREGSWSGPLRRLPMSCDYRLHLANGTRMISQLAPSRRRVHTVVDAAPRRAANRFALLAPSRLYCSRNNRTPIYSDEYNMLFIITSCNISLSASCPFYASTSAFVSQ